MKSIAIVISCLVFTTLSLKAQEVLETGGKKMPAEWIDKDTHH